MITYRETQQIAGSAYPLAESDFTEQIHSDALGDDFSSSQEAGRQECEEVLIDDNRANLGPAELVEHKLSTLLGGASLPVSHMRMQSLQGSRSHC